MAAQPQQRDVQRSASPKEVSRPQPSAAAPQPSAAAAGYIAAQQQQQRIGSPNTTRSVPSAAPQAPQAPQAEVAYSRQEYEVKKNIQDTLAVPPEPDRRPGSPREYTPLLSANIGDIAGVVRQETLNTTVLSPQLKARSSRTSPRDRVASPTSSSRSQLPANASMSSGGVTWHSGTPQPTPQLAVATEGRACSCGCLFAPEDTYCKSCGAMRPAVQSLRFRSGQEEPYIMHVWEKHPPGGSHGGASRETLRRELIDLGACSPPATFRASSAGSTDSRKR